MPPSQCLGRLVKDAPKGVWLLSFEDGGVFHLPIRCDKIAPNGDLCIDCQAKECKTIEKVKHITGTTIQGMLPSYLNGRVTEPIPFWSRLYDGEWYRLKVQNGSSISEETMVKAKVAAERAYSGVETVAPEPMPGKARKVRTKKAVAPPPVSAAPPIPPPVSAAPPAPPPPAKTRPRAPKRVGVVSATVLPPLAAVTPGSTKLPVDNIYHVDVIRREVEGRTLYYEPGKEKLYDLKFKYLGRLKEGKVISFPDSDAEM